MRETIVDLILWRHADAEEGGADPERRLSAKGRRQAKRAAAWLRKRLREDANVLVSPARRAIETADALTDHYRIVPQLDTGACASGILAAAGLHALEHHVDRLAEDHANARLLGQRLTELGAELPFPVDTNIVFAAFPGRSGPEIAARLRSAAVLCNAEPSRPDMIRLLTHLDVGAADVEEAARRMAGALRS